jgi:hypothetical protein
MTQHPLYRTFVTAAGVIALAGLVSVETAAQQGQGGSVVQGGAGTGGKATPGLEYCAKPMGAIAVVEPQSEIMAHLSRYNLQSPVSMIRMMIQQSNCFVVVERGVGMRNMMQERQLAEAGQAREGANMGGGQMVPADFILTPRVEFSEGNAGGVGGAVGGLLGRRGAAVAGALKFQEAQTTMLLADARSGVQVSAAEGSTKKADLKLGAGLFGGGVGVIAGGYGNTNEGKIIAAAFMDNYNTLVTYVRNDPTLQRQVGTLKEEAALGGTAGAGAAFNPGDVIGPKIAGVQMYSDASDKSKVVATLGRGDELVVVGASKDGFIQVQSGSAAGWIKIILVSKR